MENVSVVELDVTAHRQTGQLRTGDTVLERSESMKHRIQIVTPAQITEVQQNKEFRHY